MSGVKNSLATWLTTLLFLSLARGTTVSFANTATYLVGTSPVAVASGDFNGDGNKDLAVLNFGYPPARDNGSVSVLLGRGDGTFQAAKNFPLCKNCTGIVAGDFNGDGRDDIALVRPGDAMVNDNGDVAIFLGNDDGSFRAGPVLTPGKNPSSASTGIVARDFNGDRRLDVVVANAGDQTVSVLLGNGDGSFQSPIAYTTADVPVAVRVADLAGNGEQDLAVFMGINKFLPGKADFLLDNGDGTFRQGPVVSNGGFVEVAADFNGDKKVDLIENGLCILFCRGKILSSLWLGNGDGTFQLTNPLQQSASAAADFDGDGQLDLAGIDISANQIQVSRGNGDGTFQPPLNFGNNLALNEGIVLAADITGDHAPDLVLLNSDPTGTNNSLTVLVNSGTDFSLAASPLTPSTISTGQSASSTINLKLLTAFDNPVSLACSVQGTTIAAAPVCSFSSKSITFDANGKATARLTLTAPTGIAYLIKPTLPSSWPGSGLMWFPLGGFAFLTTGRRLLRKKRRILFFAVGLLLLSGLSLQLGCGGGGPSRDAATDYAIVITARSGSTQHSTMLSLTVQ